MGGRSQAPESLKTTEQPAEKKRGFADWMNLMKPGMEEKDHWVKIRVLRKSYFFRFHLQIAGPIKAIFKNSKIGSSIYSFSA